MKNTPIPIKSNEAYYSEHILPAALRLAELCEEGGVSLKCFLITHDDEGATMQKITAGLKGNENILNNSWPKSKEPANAR